MAILKLVFTFIMLLPQLITPYVQFALKGGIDNLREPWSAQQAFTADCAITLEKNPSKDFVILNFTDIQLNDGTLFSEEGVFTEALLKKLVADVKPDLITLTGDNCSSDVGYAYYAKFFDAFKIPWAPVMGNHDGSNGDRVNEGFDAYLLQNSEYCLFKFGPEGMGYGNYIINITQNGQIIHTLFMMDSHSSAGDTQASKINIGADGTVGYDHFWANQIEWYKWGVNGVAKLAGHTVQSSVFMHIPVLETRNAKALMCEETANGVFTVKSEYASDSFGAFHEGICSPEGNNGFFTLAKDLGSTKDMIFGHDHVNSASLVYEGIRLSYGLKSGYGSYYDTGIQGGSTLTVRADGSTAFAHCPYSAN